MTADPAVPPPGRVALRRAARMLSLLVGAACLVYFAHQVYEERASLAALTWTLATAAGLAGGSAVLALAALVDAWGWGWLLRGLGVPAESQRAMRIFCLAQFAKYLPGNVAQHLGRLELARGAGYQLGRVALSLLIENGLALGSGALFAGVGVLALGAGGLDARLPFVAAALVVGSLLGTALVRAVLARPPVIVQKLLKLTGPLELRGTFLLGLVLQHLASHAANATALALPLIASGSLAPRALWQIPAIATVAWLSGYLVPGAPAGLGVRELLVTRLLSPNTGMSAAVTAALVWRLASLTSDAVVFAAAAVSRRATPERP